MPQDRGLQGDGDRPEHAGGDDRDRDPDIVGTKSSIRRRREALREQTQLFILFQQEHDDDQQLDEAGDDGARRGADNTQLREAEAAEDQGGVHADIDDEGHAGDVERDLHRLHAAERRQQHLGQEQQEEGVLDDRQVFLSLVQDLRVRREDPEQLPGKDRAEDNDQDPHAESDPEHRPGDPPYRLRPLLAPVLGGDDDQTVAHRHRQLVHHKEDLVHQRRAGQRLLAVVPQHDVVRHVHAVGDEVLHRHHNEHGEERMVKILIL